MLVCILLLIVLKLVSCVHVYQYYYHIPSIFPHTQFHYNWQQYPFLPIQKYFVGVDQACVGTVV